MRNIISFSGIDSAGKGTQIALLQRYLNERQIRHRVIWARGSWTPGIEVVKRLVRTDSGFSEEEKEAYRTEARTNPKKQRIILILSILDLIWYWGIYYRILAWTGTKVICDRYIWDTYIDFKVNFKNFAFDQWFIWKLVEWISPKAQPSFLLYIDAKTSIQRGISKGEIFMETHEVKADKVLWYEKMTGLNKWSDVIDGLESKELVSAKILNKLGYEN